MADTDELLAAVLTATRDLEAAQQQATRTVAVHADDRAAAVRAALVGGVSIPDLMAATGLSRSRIYQIKDRT
ncbi:hypothetical protein GCM10027047_01850 [Rhodococcus aerolatus]